MAIRWVSQRASAFSQARKLKVQRIKHYYRRIMLYIRTDFKEIVWPSPMPTPPGYQRGPRPTDITWAIFKQACKDYKGTWTGEYSEPGLNDKKEKEASAKAKAKAKGKSEPSMMEDLAAAASLGGEHLKPALQRLYMTKLSVYRDALRYFIEGYKQGLKESIDHTRSAMEKSVREEAERAVREETSAKSSADQAQQPPVQDEATARASVREEPTAKSATGTQGETAAKSTAEKQDQDDATAKSTAEKQDAAAKSTAENQERASSGK